MRERRRDTRFPFAKHLQLRADPPVGVVVVDARDVSARGLSFLSDVPLAVGELLVLALQRDDSFRVEVMVRNVRAEGPRFVIGAERTSR